jgi:creatinine amidohydrolase
VTESGSLALVELTRVRLAEVAPAAVLVLPFGAVEQHGPHLPFGTDFLVVDTVARRAAAQAGREAPVVLAPTMSYGSSDHHLDVGGALSLSAEAFERSARDLFASAAVSGFRRVFVVNGHGGNDQLLHLAAQAAAGGARLAVGGGSYWTLAFAELERILPPPSLIPGHAGRFETSLALALGARGTTAAPARGGRPVEDVKPYWHAERASWERIDGYTDDPSEGSAEEGAACLEAIVAAVGACIVDFHRSTHDQEER